MKEALPRGGIAPAVLAAADEWAVARFLEGRLGYTGIAKTVEWALENGPKGGCDSPEAVFEASTETWRKLEEQA